MVLNLPLVFATAVSDLSQWLICCQSHVHCAHFVTDPFALVEELLKLVFGFLRLSVGIGFEVHEQSMPLCPIPTYGILNGILLTHSLDQQYFDLNQHLLIIDSAVHIYKHESLLSWKVVCLKNVFLGVQLDSMQNKT